MFFFNLHRGFLAIAVLSLALAGPAPAGTKPLAEAAKIVSKTMPAGCIVTAEMKGGVIAYGVAGKNEVTGIPVERIVFEIGSITKVFTSLLLAQAVIEGKTKLESTVGEILGEGQKFADLRIGQITLKQLSTHTSGLPRMPDFMGLGVDPGDPYILFDRKMLEHYLGRAKLEGTPPYDQSYSNLGAALLGDLLSRIYGKPWETLVAEKITGPLGMKDTMTAPGEDQEKRLAPPHAGAGKAMSWHFKTFAAAGALRSTAADLILFGNSFLHPEKTQMSVAIKLMMQPQTKSGEIGLGIMMFQENGRRVFWHNGGTGGYRTMFRVVPELGEISLVLINNAAFDVEKVVDVAKDEKPRTQESGKILSPEQLAEYEGVYAISAKANFTVLRRGGQLWSQITGQAFFPLFPHEKDDRFFLKITAAEEQFDREDGRIISLTNFQHGRSMTAKKTDKPLPQITFRTAKELAPYSGIYELAPGAVFTLEVRNVTLFAKLTGQEFKPIFEKRGDWFEYDVVEAALEFERDKDGKLVALKLHQNGRIQRAAKKP